MLIIKVTVLPCVMLSNYLRTFLKLYFSCSRRLSFVSFCKTCIKIPKNVCVSTMLFDFLKTSHIFTHGRVLSTGLVYVNLPEDNNSFDMTYFSRLIIIHACFDTLNYGYVFNPIKRYAQEVVDYFKYKLNF